MDISIENSYSKFFFFSFGKASFQTWGESKQAMITPFVNFQKRLCNSTTSFYLYPIFRRHKKSQKEKEKTTNGSLDIPVAFRGYFRHLIWTYKLPQNASYWAWNLALPLSLASLRFSYQNPSFSQSALSVCSLGLGFLKRVSSPPQPCSPKPPLLSPNSPLSISSSSLGQPWPESGSSGNFLHSTFQQFTPPFFFFFFNELM